MSLCPWLSSGVRLCWLELESVAARYKWRVRVLDTLAAREVDKICDGDKVTTSLSGTCDGEVEWDALLRGVWFEFSVLVEEGLACFDFPTSSTAGSCRDRRVMHVKLMIITNVIFISHRKVRDRNTGVSIPGMDMLTDVHPPNGNLGKVLKLWIFQNPKYCRTGFNCEYLLIITVNCKFFLRSQLISKHKRAHMLLYGTGSTFEIIGFVLWSDLPTVQSLNHAFKTRPTVNHCVPWSCDYKRHGRELQVTTLWIRAIFSDSLGSSFCWVMHWSRMWVMW